MQVLVFIGVLICVAVGLAALVVLERISSRGKGNFQQLSAELGAVQSAHTAAGKHHDADYTFEHFEGAKNSPPFLRVRVHGLAGVWFRVVREREVDRVFKSAGFTKEIQSGDQAFDRDFYIESDSGDVPLGFFADERRRRAIRQIMELGFTSIENSSDVLVAEWSDFDMEGGVKAAAITTTVDKLIELRGAALAGVVRGSLAAAPTGPMGMARWQIALGVILVAIGVAYAGISYYKPLDAVKIAVWSLAFSLPAMLLFLWYVAHILRGTSTGHRNVLMIAVASLVAFPALGAGAAAGLNATLDESPPVSHVMPVLATSMYDGKYWTWYNVVVQSWRPDRATESIAVNSPTYEQLVPRQSWLNVITKRGRFGFEWRVGYSL